MSVFADNAAGARARTRLEEGRLVWLVTVGADGTPQPNPVWFLWDGAETLLVYNRANAHRLAHLDARPHVALHFDASAQGGDIVVISGTAHRAPKQSAPHENAAYLAKYGDAMARVAGSHEQFSVEYPVAVEIEMRRVRGF